MRRNRDWLTGPASVVMLVGLVIGGTGCGSSEQRPNSLRPPATIDVAVKIDDRKVEVAPDRIGAGPILLVASNQSRASYRLTIDGPSLKQSVGPINPQDTATLKVSVKPGEYTLSADGSSSVRPVTLTVGAKRPSAQNELLQP
jgi:hypothetical protein